MSRQRKFGANGAPSITPTTTTSPTRTNNESTLEEASSISSAVASAGRFEWHSTGPQVRWSHRCRYVLIPIFITKALSIAASVTLHRPLTAATNWFKRLIGADVPVTTWEEMSPAFLTQLLRERGVLKNGDSVSQIVATPVGTIDLEESAASSSSSVSTACSSTNKKKKTIAQGQMGSMMRLELEYSGPIAATASYPISIIIKSTPTQRLPLLIFNLIFKLFDVEQWSYDGPNLNLYDRLDPRVASIPRCFGSYFNPSSGAGWLILEDLKWKDSPYVMYSSHKVYEGEALPMSKLYNVIDGINAWHQALKHAENEHHQLTANGQPELSPFRTYPHALSCNDRNPGLFNFIWQEAVNNFMFALSGAGWPASKKHVGLDVLGPELIEVGEWIFKPSTTGMWSLVNLWHEWSHQRPEFFGITHHDLHLGNQFFDSSASSQRPWVLYDLQVMRWRPYVLDLSYFLLSATDVNDCIELEQELLQRYFNNMPYIKQMTSASERASAWNDFMMLHKSAIVYCVYLCLGTIMGILLQAFQAHNSSSGLPPVAFHEFPLGRDFVKFSLNLKAQIKHHRLHEFIYSMPSHTTTHAAAD